MPTYEQRINALAKRYDKRIRKILANVTETFAAVEWMSTAVGYMCDDQEHEWCITLLPEGITDKAAYVAILLGEQREHEGEGSGVTFRLDVIGMGGRVLGGLAPGNYTKDCWLKLSDKDAIEARFSILENADPAEILSLIEE